ncbi:MAG: D-glycero-beta-D-manno-heptose-7-phosphate kinase [Acidobacteria bacterium]|nr:D-glycero-beta-D-manno-heptose-7-phosphate kinase [Acidobacteriota bacterium]
MIAMNKKRMESVIRAFKGRRVCVLGDLMVDKYIWGEVTRISPEAPVPIVEVCRDSICLGGAGNVARTLETLGAVPYVVGVIGSDPEGLWIRDQFSERSGLVFLKNRPTTVKTRIIAHQQQVVRVDQETRTPFPEQIRKNIAAIVREAEFEGLVISDYNKGMVSRALMADVLGHCRRKKIPVYVDPKVQNFSAFTPVTLVTPNHVEAESIVHHRCSSDEEVEKAGEKIFERIQSDFLIIKRGDKGMSVFEAGKKAMHIPTVAKEIFDVTGAGDTVIATASIALLAGSDIREAAVLANAAAGVVVGKVGTASLNPDELLASLSF